MAGRALVEVARSMCATCIFRNIATDMSVYCLLAPMGE